MTAPSVASPVSRCWTLVGSEGAVDVEVTAADDAPLAQVLPALTRTIGIPVTGLWAGSARLSDEVPLRDPVLRHGAVLGLGRPAPRAGRDGAPGSALELHVVGGPEAGRVIPLTQGRHVVGRGSGASVRIDDPDLSRRHAIVDVGGAGVTVADAGSSNGSRLDDDDLDERPHPWVAGAVLRVGASSLAVASPGAPAAAVDAAPGGRMRLRPTRRLGAPPPDVEVPFPRPPSPGPRRRLAWVAVALPAVGGVLMAWLLDAPTFLFFALLSPVVALGTWLSERWSGRRSGRRDAATHAVELLVAERRVASAVRAHVRAAEAAAPDPATLTAAARRPSRLLWSRTADDADGLVVRIGSGPGPTGVTRLLPEGGRVRETAAHLPALVDLRATGGLGVTGPRARTSGVLRAVVAQVTALHPPGEVDLLLLTEGGLLRDWTWARWLPHLAPGAAHVGGRSGADDEGLLTRLRAEVARRRPTAGRPGGRSPGRLVVLVDRDLPARVAGLLAGARDSGVLVLTAAASPEELPVPVGAVLQLSGETGDTGVLRTAGAPDRPGIVVDRVPRATAAELARDLAALAPPAAADALPRSLRLADLPGPGLRRAPSIPSRTEGTADALQGRWLPHRDRLCAVLGATADGAVEVDLCRDGPHALVAGTTGSGKSELLQTLITGLALAHPPDRCAFLLVDYKGGAAFGEAVGLPHTVGLVTDLDAQSTRRALRSLTAELTRRETVLAGYRVADVAGLPASADLGRLVIVVDEFASLAEELPEFVPGLVAIAQRGRSLGVHLVLATQRPGGVVSPEIRANCTLRICLRTTDEADSRDVLGVPDGAHLPVDLPGRALLRTGSGPPLALQVARVAAPAPDVTGTAPEADRWTWPMAGPASAPRCPGGETDLAVLTRELTEHARASGARVPHRPWRPPLPDCVVADALDDFDPGCAPGSRLRVGLIDRPDRQLQEPLELDLDAGGTWLAVGGPRSGRSTLLHSVLAEAVHRFGPDELHVHVVACGGGELTRVAAGLPHSGTVIDREDALRTVRLLDRLHREVAERRAGTAGPDRPRLLLLVDGLETVSSLLDEADPAQGSAALLRLTRDGAAAGLTCVLTADRAAPGGRVAAVARERLVLPLPDRADYAIAGIPPRAVPGHRPPGRALLGEDAVECQLALPRDVDHLAHPLPRTAVPLRIVELPADPELALPRRPAGRPTGTLQVPIGPGGDEARPLVVDLLRAGGLLIAGPPRSGRSAALAAIARHVSHLGVPVLWLGRPAHAPDGSPAEMVETIEPSDAPAVAAWLASRPEPVAVVLADDVGAAADWAALTAVAGTSASCRVVLVAASTAGQLSGHYQGPVAALRRDRSGLLLCPGPGDADLLGVRLPRTPLPVRPGSGWLVTGGVVDRVQVARRRTAEAPPTDEMQGDDA